MRKSYLAPFLMALAGVFFIGNSVYAMPIGTLLYRTSRDGEMYGQNTKEIFQLLDVSLENGIKTMKVNCGHVGMYVGKIDGEEMVLEAVSNGVQLTPAKYFVDTREGEKLVGARIPKNIKAKASIITQVAESLADNKLSYDWGFSTQKGSGSGQWICVGLTEKIYESLKPTLESKQIDSKNILQSLEYDPAKYAIDITPDGFEDDNVYNKETGDCLATDKEYSNIAQKYFEPSYLIGKITNKNRYFFLPYTQFIQPTLKDVAVDIQLESDFEASKVRGKEKLLKILAVAVKNSVGDQPVNTIVGATTIALQAQGLVFKAVASVTLPIANEIGQNVFNLAKNIGGRAIALFSKNSESTGNVLSAIETAIKTPNGDYTLQASELGASTKALADSEVDTSLKQVAGVKTTSTKEIVQPKVKTVKKKKTEPILVVATTTVKNIIPEKISEEKIIAKLPEKETLKVVDPLLVKPLLPIVSTPAKPIVYPLVSSGGGGGASQSSQSVVVAPVVPVATTTVATTTVAVKQVPVITSFSLADHETADTFYSLSSIVDLKVEIENPASVEKYFVGEQEQGGNSWVSILPLTHNLSAGDGQKSVYLFISYNNPASTTSKIARIFLDMTAPTSSLNDLAAKYSSTGFTVAWQGNDTISTMHTTSTPLIYGSGIKNYEIDYGLSTSNSVADAVWQSWLKETTATSSVFSEPVPLGDYVFFRARAKDRAGNLGDWSPIKSTMILASPTVLISEFAVAGRAGTYDEFVELYNPSEKSVSLAGWNLQSHGNGSVKWVNRVGSTGLSTTTVIAAHSYYILGAKDCSLSIVFDYRHSANWGFADTGGSLKLVDDNGQEVDKVSYGSSALDDSDLASADFSNSVAERKAMATSTSALMASLVDHSLRANAYDTDSDTDFVINSKADPQSSSFSIEPDPILKIIPAKITDLSFDFTHTTPDSISVFWSVPESANLVTGAKYEFKYKIKDGSCDLGSSWDEAVSVSAESLPLTSVAAGTKQYFKFSGLQVETEYCFALKTFNGYNFSSLSNQASGKTKAIPLPPDIQTLFSQETGVDNFRCGSFFRWCGQTFVATKNNITGFQVKSAGYYGGTPLPGEIELCEDSPNSYKDYCENPIKREFLPDSEFYNFATSAPLLVGQTYLIKIHAGGYGYAKFLQYAKDDPYSGGRAHNTDGNYPLIETDDLWFKVFYDNNFLP